LKFHSVDHIKLINNKEDEIKQTQPVEINNVQIYMHNIFQTPVMYKVTSSFVENFLNSSLEHLKYLTNPTPTISATTTTTAVTTSTEKQTTTLELNDIFSNYNTTTEESIAVVDEVKNFINHLQTFMFSCFQEDCYEILAKNQQQQQFHCKNSKNNVFHDNVHLSNQSEVYTAWLIKHEKKQQKQFEQINTKLSSSNSTELNTFTTTINNNAQSIEQQQQDDLLLDEITEDELRLKLLDSIRKQVEIEVYFGCGDRLRKIIELTYKRLDGKLRSKMFKLYSQKQDFYGILPHHISPTNWENVIHLMKLVSMQTLPCDRFEALITVAKAIPALYQIEHPFTDKILSADDTLPIFIYVLVKAQIPNVVSVHRELQIFCDPQKKMSEMGYYLATFEASLQHIFDAKLKNGLFH
jgi:hypothetical protein